MLHVAFYISICIISLDGKNVSKNKTGGAHL